jgi:hypothetical protein
VDAEEWQWGRENYATDPFTKMSGKSLDIPDVVKGRTQALSIYLLKTYIRTKQRKYFPLQGIFGLVPSGQSSRILLWYLLQCRSHRHNATLEKVKSARRDRGLYFLKQLNKNTNKKMLIKIAKIKSCF